MGSGGQPTGLAVELVREAARRRGVRLEWLQQTGSSETALRDKRVDLWPLITITPERKKFIHITDPYLESEQCLLVRADSPHTQIQDLDRAKVSYFDLPMNYRQLHSYLPNAQLLARSTLKDSIEDVCQQNSAAVFLEEYTAISALMSGLSCTGQPTRLIPIPKARPRLGIGATFEARAAADAIREEIGALHRVPGMQLEAVSLFRAHNRRGPTLGAHRMRAHDLDFRHDGDVGFAPRSDADLHRGTQPRQSSPKDHDIMSYLLHASRPSLDVSRVRARGSRPPQPKN
jgi:hypothetical protein